MGIIQGMVAYPGGVDTDPDPTFKKIEPTVNKKNPDPTLEKDPVPIGSATPLKRIQFRVFNGSVFNCAASCA